MAEIVSTRKSLVHWILTIGIPCLILLLPVNGTFTSDLKIFMAITGAAILFFVFEQVNGTVVTILLPIAYVLILKAPIEVVYRPWSMSILWMLVGGFVLANLMEKVGLLRRIAYKCILMTGASYKGIIWGIALAGVIIFLLMPNDNAAVTIAALAYGICISLDLKKGPEAAGIMLAAAMAAILPSGFLFNTGIFLFFGLGEAATGPLTIGWFEWLYRCFPLGLYYVVIFYIITRMFGKHARLNGKEYFRAEYEAMGIMSADEKRVLIDIALLMTFILTESFHHIDVLWGFAVIPFLMFFPGLKVADGADLRKVDWNMIFFAAGCLSIGMVAGTIGIGDLIGSFAVPVMEGKSHTLVLFLVYIGYFLLNFIMTPMAINVTFAMPLAQVAHDIGLNPVALYILMNEASDQIIMPYETVIYLIYFSFGMMRMKDFIKFYSVKTLVHILFTFLLLIPWWKFTGFLSLP